MRRGRLKKNKKNKTTLLSDKLDNFKEGQEIRALSSTVFEIFTFEVLKIKINKKNCLKLLFLIFQLLMWSIQYEFYFKPFSTYGA